MKAKITAYFLFCCYIVLIILSFFPIIKCYSEKPITLNGVLTGFHISDMEKYNTFGFMKKMGKTIDELNKYDHEHTLQEKFKNKLVFLLGISYTFRWFFFIVFIGSILVVLVAMSSQNDIRRIMLLRIACMAYGIMPLIANITLQAIIRGLSDISMIISDRGPYKVAYDYGGIIQIVICIICTVIGLVYVKQVSSPTRVDLGATNFIQAFPGAVSVKDIVTHTNTNKQADATEATFLSGYQAPWTMLQAKEKQSFREELEYALKYRSDDGMMSYLKKIAPNTKETDTETVRALLQMTPASARIAIKAYLENK